MKTKIAVLLCCLAFVASQSLIATENEQICTEIVVQQPLGADLKPALQVARAAMYPFLWTLKAIVGTTLGVPVFSCLGGMMTYPMFPGSLDICMFTYRINAREDWDVMVGRWLGLSFLTTDGSPCACGTLTK